MKNEINGSCEAWHFSHVKKERPPPVSSFLPRLIRKMVPRQVIAQITGLKDLFQNVLVFRIICYPNFHQMMDLHVLKALLKFEMCFLHNQLKPCVNALNFQIIFLSHNLVN